MAPFDRNIQKVSFFSLFILLGYFLNAQDLIVLKNGEEIKAKIIRISDSEIEYKKYINPTGPDYVLKSDKVIMIKYQNGNKDIFDQKDSDQLNSNTISKSNEKNNTPDDSTKASELKNQQALIIKQNEVIIKNLDELNNKQLKQDSIVKSDATKLQERISKQQAAIEKNRDESNKLTKQMLDSIAKTNKLLVDKTEHKSDNWKPKPVGFGINLSGLLGIDANQSLAYTPNVIYLNFNLNKNFRIEAEVAGIFLKDTTPVLNQFFGISMFGMWQKRKINYYTGLKVMGFYEKTKDITTVLSPIIGSEYIFGERFSLGIEIGVAKYMNTEHKEWVVGFNRVIFRFYL